MYGISPTNDELNFQRHLIKSTLEKVVGWCEDSEAFDALPRLQSLKKGIKSGVETFRRIFNCCGEPRVTHKCFDGTQAPPLCCQNEAVVLRDAKHVVKDVIVGLLLAGSPEPTETKWFSMAVRLRAVWLGISANNLLRRAWELVFADDMAEALAHADADDLDDDLGNHVARRRKRHRKVGGPLLKWGAPWEGPNRSNKDSDGSGKTAMPSSESNYLTVCMYYDIWPTRRRTFSYRVPWSHAAHKR